MTIQDLHALLCSRSYYTIDGDNYYRFSGNSVVVDRKAAIAFALEEQDGCYYMGFVPQIDAVEPLLRIVLDHPDGKAFHFYGKESGREILVLE